MDWLESFITWSVDSIPSVNKLKNQAGIFNGSNLRDVLEITNLVGITEIMAAVMDFPYFYACLNLKNITKVNKESVCIEEQY